MLKKIPTKTKETPYFFLIHTVVDNKWLGEIVLIYIFRYQTKVIGKLISDRQSLNPNLFKIIKTLDTVSEVFPIPEESNMGSFRISDNDMIFTYDNKEDIAKFLLIDYRSMLNYEGD